LNFWILTNRINMKKRIANIIIEQLIDQNIGFLFGVTGKAISPLIDATLDYSNFEFIASKHESGASLMAYGYAQGSGKIGVCCSTTGGGCTNLATGVATAYMNSIPMIVITGQISTHEFAKGAFQESTGFCQSINSVDFFKPITKESFLANSHSNIPELIRYAIRAATSGRMGPIHISIPFDIQMAEIEYIKPKVKGVRALSNFFYDTSILADVLFLIKQSKAPVFLIGWGGVLSGASKEIINIAEKLKIPIATTLQGKGAIASNHPLHIGIMGVCGHPMAADYIFEKSDLLIAIGTSFGEFTTFNWDTRFGENRKIVQIDIDNREIGKNYPVDIGLVGDAKVIIHQLSNMLDFIDLKAKASGVDIENRIKNDSKYIDSHVMNDESIPIKPQRLMKEVGENCPKNTIFLADSGSHWAWAMHYLPVYETGGFYPATGLASMGAAICSSIGVKLSKPNHPVVCICGDGSFLMYGNEISTAQQYNIPVVWIILNDSKYGLPSTSLKKMFNRSVGVELSKINFLNLASVFNIKGYRVENPKDLSTVIIEAISLNKPVVIDVVIDTNEIPPLASRKLTETTEAVIQNK